MNGIITLQHTEFGYGRKGFCSIVNQIIDIAHVHYINFNNFNISILDEQISNLFNLDQKYIQNSYDVSKIWLNLFFNNSLPYSFNAHMPANKQFLLERNYVYNNILKIKDIFLQEFLTLKNNLVDNKTLAVQIRGTDKITELPAINESQILKKIDYNLTKNNLTSILLCTDDIKYLKLLEDTFGKIVKSNKENKISSNGMPLHFFGDRLETNKQVMSDVFLLSECKHILYCYSNVSHLALTLGINNFKTMELLN